MDAPWSVHVPKVIFWVIVEVELITIGVMMGQELRHTTKEGRVRSPIILSNNLFMKMGDFHTKSQKGVYSNHYRINLWGIMYNLHFTP